MFSNGIRDGVRRLFKLPSRTRSHVEADVNQELETFLAERVDYLVARGMSLSDARFEALKRLGPSLADASSLLQNSAITRERRMRIRDMFDDFKQDLRYAGRTLKRDVRFSVFAIIVIALGIGASVTVFSVANTLLVRPLPFSDADRLVWIQNGNSDGLSGQTTQVNHMLDLRAQSKSYADIEAYMAFYGIGDANLTDKGNSVRLSNVQVTQKFFPLLGVQPFLGRQFTQEESAQNGPLVAMMSYSLWERQFASDKNIIGKSITVNSQSVMVVGVLPETFDFGQVFAPGTRIDFFSPFPLSEQTNKWGNTMAMLGRLKSGATLAGAKAELALLGPQIAKAHPERNGFEPSVVLLQEHVTGGVKGALIALSFAVGVVMLIVCANLSNLLLARSTTRNKEMAVRAALGAGRRRLVRQMLTESMVLALCGAAIGIVVAIVGTRAIAHMDAVSLPLLASVRVDVSALTFAVLLSLGSGIAFGLAPALQIPESAMHDALKVSGRSTTDGKRGAWIRRSLVVSEIAMACMLLVGSGLLIRSFLKVLEVDLGFKPEMVASIRVDADRKTMASQELFDAYVNEVLRIARALPGVKSAGLSDGLPLGSNRTWGVSAKGVTYKREEYPQAYVRMASDGFMASLQTNLIEGRDFTAQDVPKSEKVVIINRSLARLLWPGESAVGKFANIDTVRRVVGVVADVRHLALEKDAGNEMYLPLRQTGDFSSLNLVVRTTLPPEALARSIRSALQPVAPNLALNQFQTLQTIVDKSVSPRRFFTELLGVFAGFALVLALLGIYGVISYTVSNRTQEIGVRIALGASANQIQGRIIRETLGLAFVGMLLGTIGSWLLTRTLSAFLFGVTNNDPATFATMLVTVTAVAILSGYLPARRAARIDPVVAFRST